MGRCQYFVYAEETLKMGPIRARNGEMVWPWYPSQEDWNEAVKSAMKGILEPSQPDAGIKEEI